MDGVNLRGDYNGCRQRIDDSASYDRTIVVLRRVQVSNERKRKHPENIQPNVVSQFQPQHQSATAVTSPITNLSPGKNGAVNAKILDGKKFVIDGAFEEVDPYSPGAIQSITTMIVSFGGSVQSRISKNIRKYIQHCNTLNYISLLTFTFAMLDADYLLAGQGVSSEKIKTATNEKNKATVISLQQLQKLLLGQLTFDTLKQRNQL